MKRKKGGKRCAQQLIERWQAEASGEVAERLGALGYAVEQQRHMDAERKRLGVCVETMLWPQSSPQQLRQDW